jgi:hypothetical protein
LHEQPPALACLQSAEFLVLWFLLKLYYGEQIKVKVNMGGFLCCGVILEDI